MNAERSVILVGGIEAGKSNYLFRLWLSINRGASRLRKSGLPDNAEYLEAGAASLLNGKFAGRTEQEAPHEIQIPVTWTDGDASLVGSLVVPDCAGEAWWKIYRRREWSETWEQFLATASGCLVFVRATSDKNVPSLDWISYGRYFGTSPPPAGFESVKGEIPTQVILVDLIQCVEQAMRDHHPGRRPRIGLVVSAWDTVQMEMKQFGPMAFIDDNFPLLGQYLTSNADAIDVQTFGVTIVDGDLNDEHGFRQEYFTRQPTEVGTVVWSTAGSVMKNSDITLPVVWAMGSDIPNASGLL